MSASGFRKARVQANKAKVSRSIFVLAMLLGLPAAGVFCLQWAVQLSSQPGARSREMTQTSMSPRQDLRSQLMRPGQTSSTSPAWTYASALVNDPFPSGYGSGMIGALADPFYESLVTGAGEGRLVLQGRNRGVMTYGPPRPARRSSSLSDRAILLEIQAGVGGSFSNFVNNVFGSPLGKADAKAADPREENPFAKPAQDGAVAQPATKETGGEPKVASKPADPKPANPAPDSKQSDAAPAAPITLATTVRPQIMLHMGVDGTLQAFPAARLNDHTFESVELGIRQFDLLTFASPADIATSISMADFNGDGVADICFLDSRAGMLRFFNGNSAGGYAESTRIDVGTGPRSLAAGDFNFDGRTDMAVSNIGIGTLTYIYLGGAEDSPAFRSLWLDRYRDYIAAADTTGSGILDLIGMNFANVAEVLSLNPVDGSVSGKWFEYRPALDCRVKTFDGRTVELNAVLLQSSLSLNLQNPKKQLTNVLNVQPGAGCYIIVGDLNYNNSVSVALGTLKK